MEICQITERIVRCEEGIKQIIAELQHQQRQNQQKLAELERKVREWRHEPTDSQPPR